MRRTTTILLFASILAACQKEAEEKAASSVDAPVTIGVAATPHEDVTVTRAAYTVTEPDVSNPLSAYVWASSESANYSNCTHCFTTFYSAYSVLDKSGTRAVQYAVSGASTPEMYFVGLSPASDDGTVGNDVWSLSDNKATYTFNGADDVMYAPEVHSHYTGDVPVLHFYHVLTHLRFIIRCEGDDADSREEVSYAWGKLKNIRLIKQNNFTDDPKNTVTVSLSPVATSLTQVLARSTFSSTADYLSLFKAGTVGTYFPQNYGAADNSNLWYTLPTDEEGEEAAYMLCAPVTATYQTGGSLTDEYTLELNTEKRSNVKVGIDLKTGTNSYFSGSTMGCEFLVTLTFRFGKVIAVATAMHDWEGNGGQTIQGIGEEDD